MRRNVLLASVVVGVGIVCLAILSATESQDDHDGDGRGGLFVVTDRHGNPLSATPGTGQDRESRKQEETPEQLRKRVEYLRSLESDPPSGSH